MMLPGIDVFTIFITKKNLQLEKKHEIKLSSGFYHHQNVVKVEFNYDRELEDFLKENTPAAWSANLNCWYIPENKFLLEDFIAAMEPVASIDFSKLQKRF
jgi:hypothetical protein